MADPSVATMQKWLKDVTEVEERLYVVDDAIDQLSRTLENLPLSYEVREPAKHKRKTFGDCLYGALPSGIFGFCLGPIAYLISVLGGCSHGLVAGFNAIFDNVPVLVLGSLAGSVVLTVVRIPFVYLADADEVAELNAKDYDEYYNALAQTKAQISRNKKAHPVYVAELERMKGVRDSLTAARDQLYATGYLDKAYWGLVPAATMYGYLATGRCTCVYGHGGVIDTFVHDNQFQLLCGKLDEIIERLDEIQQTQVALAESLNRANDEIRGLRGQISQLTDRVTDESRDIQKCIQYENDCNRWLAVVALSEYERR